MNSNLQKSFENLMTLRDWSKYGKLKDLILVLVLAIPQMVSAQVSITSASPYTQDFNSLASTGTSSTLPAGWFFNETGANANATFTAGTGSSNAGDTYSFGSTGSTDRAFGGLLSGSLLPTIGASFTNNTGSIITSFAISYTGEQWRLGTLNRADRLDFQYSTDATSPTTGTWTDVNALDFTAPVTTGTTGLLNGNTAANRTAVSSAISLLSISNGSTIWIRWSDFNATNADDGLGVDDFSITATFAPVNSPVLTPNPSAVSSLNYIQGSGPSVAGSYTLTGSNLTGDITLTAPTNFEISKISATTDFGNTLTLSPSSGSIASTTIYARLKSGLTANTYTGNITHTGGGLSATVNVALSGNVNPPPTVEKISAIQGSGNTAALTGTRTIEGIVIKTFIGSTKLNGYYVQEEDSDSDANPATSEGIFVFDPSGTNSNVAVGDKVQITGTVGEFTSSASSLTQLSSITALTKLSSGNPLPTVTNVQIPVTNISDLERYEGMLVNMSAATGSLTVTEHFQLGRFGQIILAANGASNQTGTDARLDQYTQFNAPSTSGYAAYLAEIAKRTIILDDGSSISNPDPIIFGRGGNPLSATNTLRLGDAVSSITAVLDQRFEGYRLQTTEGVNFQPTNPREATPQVTGGTLKVGGFNVLNYFNGNGAGGGFPTSRGADNAAEFTRQRNKILNVLISSGADVLGLNEIENDGYGSASAIQDLVNGLNAIAGAGTYSFINPGNISTDQITVAIVYKPGKVTPVGAAAAIPNAFGTGSFDAVGRKPLAQTFQENATGGIFTYVINHFKSKGTSSGGAGDADANDGQALSNGTRNRQSQDLLAWLATKPTGTTDADYLLGGDYNAYAMEDPITTIKNGGYSAVLPNTSYSYAFDGQMGSLDHAFSSTSLSAQVAAATKWHVNSDEPLVLDYNTENKTPGQVTSLYANDQYRAADHDPVIVCLNLKDDVAPTITCVTDKTKSTLSTSCDYKTIGTEFDPTSSDNIGVVSTTYVLTGATTGTGSSSLSGVNFNKGITTIEWTVMDAAGNSAKCSLKVTVIDDVKPVIICPANQTITLGSFECSRIVVFADPSVSDNCSASAYRTGDFISLVSGMSFTPGIYKLSYGAVDAAGNQATECSFTIRVNSQLISGRLTCIPQLTISLDERQCINSIDAAGLLIDNNYYCAGYYNLSIQGKTNNSFTSADLGQTFTATVKDNYNNSCSTTVKVVDTKAPVLNAPLDEVITCANVGRDGSVLVSLSLPSIIYECGKTSFTFQDRVIKPTAGQATFTSRPADFPSDKNFNFTSAYNASSIIIRTYTATDEFNNSSTTSRVIYVKNISLNQVSCPKDVTVSCVQGNFNTNIQSTGIPFVANTGTLQDISCGIDYFYSDEKTNTAQGFIIKRTWRLVDRKTQETQSCVQTITVNDTKPTISCVADKTIVIGADKKAVVLPTDLATASDNCTPANALIWNITEGGSANTSLTYTCADLGTKSIILTVKDAGGNESTCTTSIKIVDNSNYCVNIPLLSISGGINKETGENVTATVKVFNQNNLMGSVENSNYQFSNLVSGNSYRVSPERDNDVANGVTTFDIALMGKHILDIQPLQSPYQLIAADVNRDGQVDGQDMLLVRNLILRRTTRFANNTAWRFIPKSYVFRNPNNPFDEDFPETLNLNAISENISKADFIAVKVGDVNLSSKSDLTALSVRNSRPIETLNIVDKKLEAGKEYTIDVTLNNPTLLALQFGLKWDKTKVTSFKVQKGNLPQFDGGNIEQNDNNGVITAVWANTQKGQLLDENSILQLVITPRQSIWLHDLISLDEKMENLSYNTDNAQKATEKQLSLKLLGSKNDNLVLELHQNRPNPFANETTISFILPDENATELSIYDVNGRKVYTLNRTFNKGYNEVTINNTVFKNSGIYFYRLQSDKFNAVKRMQYIGD